MTFVWNKEAHKDLALAKQSQQTDIRLYILLFVYISRDEQVTYSISCKHLIAVGYNL